jgi:MFS family permease
VPRTDSATNHQETRRRRPPHAGAADPLPWRRCQPHDARVRTGRSGRPVPEPASRAGSSVEVVPPRGRWAVLASLTIVSFVLLLDDTAVSIVLPSIRRQLHTGLSGLEWVVNGYTLPIAALMLLAGKLADRHDRRAIFLHGVGVFTVASLLAGLAPSLTVLIAARALQGVGAALLIPASLSIIASGFDERERGTALGVWAGVSATALGLGPLVGALVNGALGWQSIFLLNVPLGLVAWIIACRLLPVSRSQRTKLPLDLKGAAAAAVGLTALTLALSNGTDYGWDSPQVALLAAAALAGVGAFLAYAFRGSRRDSPGSRGGSGSGGER